MEFQTKHPFFRDRAGDMFYPSFVLRSYPRDRRWSERSQWVVHKSSQKIRDEARREAELVDEVANGTVEEKRARRRSQILERYEKSLFDFAEHHPHGKDIFVLTSVYSAPKDFDQDVHLEIPTMVYHDSFHPNHQTVHRVHALLHSLGIASKTYTLALCLFCGLEVIDNEDPNQIRLPSNFPSWSHHNTAGGFDTRIAENFNRALVERIRRYNEIAARRGEKLFELPPYFEFDKRKETTYQKIVAAIKKDVVDLFFDTIFERNPESRVYVFLPRRFPERLIVKDLLERENIQDVYDTFWNRNRSKKSISDLTLGLCSRKGISALKDEMMIKEGIKKDQVKKVRRGDFLVTSPVVSGWPPIPREKTYVELKTDRIFYFPPERTGDACGGLAYCEYKDRSLTTCKVSHDMCYCGRVEEYLRKEGELEEIRGFLIDNRTGLFPFSQVLKFANRYFWIDLDPVDSKEIQKLGTNRSSDIFASDLLLEDNVNAYLRRRRLFSLRPEHKQITRQGRVLHHAHLMLSDWDYHIPIERCVEIGTRVEMEVGGETFVVGFRFDSLFYSEELDGYVGYEFKRSVAPFGSYAYRGHTLEACSLGACIQELTGKPFYGTFFGYLRNLPILRENELRGTRGYKLIIQNHSQRDVQQAKQLFAALYKDFSRWDSDPQQFVKDATSHLESGLCERSEYCEAGLRAFKYQRGM